MPTLNFTLNGKATRVDADNDCLLVDMLRGPLALTGTHQGDFLGVPATGKPIEIRGMQIGRFEDGKMVERWGSSDELGILKQIGAAPV